MGACKSFVFCQKIENEKIISQIVGISKLCAQNGDRVFARMTKVGIFVV